MADEIRRLIRVRTEKGATFKRDGFGKKKQLSSSWRKPRGQHSKQREQKKAKGNLPKPGFGSPIGVRGMHPSGFFDVLVHTTDDLAGLDPKKQAIRIAATVGNRKRAAIQEKALLAGLRVLNARAAKATEKPAAPAKAEEEKPQEPKAKKATAPKAKPVPEKGAEQPEAKKETKKAPKEPAPKTAKEAKKAKPAETTEPVTPAEEPSKKKEQKPKAPKAKAKAGAEAKPKKAATSKAEPAKEAKPTKKAAAKPAAKPKKKTSTEVKDNE